MIILSQNGCIVIGSLLVGLCAQSQWLCADGPPAGETLATNVDQRVIPASVRAPSLAGNAFAKLARSDPAGALRAALEHYEASVRDYTCTFEKQERVSGRLTAEQV